MLENTCRRIHAAPFRRSLIRQLLRVAKRSMRVLQEWRYALHLALMRKRAYSLNAGDSVTFFSYTVLLDDGPNFYMLYKDIFVKQIYHFSAQRPDPFILDCGSNIGMSVLYFKLIYPEARIIGFEPDPAVFRCLQQNVASNRLTGVELIQAALSSQEASLVFQSDGNYGGHLGERLPKERPDRRTEIRVPSTRLCHYLTEPVDFLKMNIEGAEWEVLRDSQDELRKVKQMVIEYHHLPGLPRTLHRILELLDHQGFEYLVNDLDSQTNRAVLPPFHLNADTSYFLLIYALRTG